jgi:hypothetical protein
MTHTVYDTSHSRFVGSSFVLPGEGQKIGRVMEAFARRYHNCNPNNIFADAGTASRPPTASSSPCTLVMLTISYHCLVFLFVVVVVVV